MRTSHGRTCCEFDELQVDRLPNRILLATIGRLLKSQHLDADLRKDLRVLDRDLHGIKKIPLTKNLF